jgi:hypothetical protein
MNESRAGAEELWNEAIADSGLNLAKPHRFAHSGQYTVVSSSIALSSAGAVFCAAR